MSGTPSGPLITDPRFARAQLDARFKHIRPKDVSAVPEDDDRFVLRPSMLDGVKGGTSEQKLKTKKKEKSESKHKHRHRHEHRHERSDDDDERSSAADDVGERQQEKEETKKKKKHEKKSHKDKKHKKKSKTHAKHAHDAEKESSESAAEEDSVPEMEKETHRLALVNFDWEHLKATDIYMLLYSFLPPGGSIHSVTVYPSKYGMEMMAKEDVEGPQLRPSGSGDESASDLSENELVRRYQLRRLRYYFAVIDCDSPATAAALYNSCDGMEVERSANVLDLRYIADEEVFTQPARDTCTSLPGEYHAPDFQVKALQSTRVDLTWDETPAERTAALRRAAADDSDLVDLNTYVASDSDDLDTPAPSGSDAGAAGVAPPSESDGGSARRAGRSERSKYKKLLRELAGGERQRDQEMEITFTPGLSEKAEALLAERQTASGEPDETPWEKHLRKLAERKRAKRAERRAKLEARRAGASAEEDEGAARLGGMSREAREAKAAREAQEERERAELALLVDEDAKAKKSEFTVDTADARFAALYERPEYAIDPSDPKFKKTPGMAALLSERRKRHERKLEQMASGAGGASTAAAATADRAGTGALSAELQQLVASVKRKADEALATRKKPAPMHGCMTELVFPFALHAANETGAVVAELVKYVLYMRQQIPSPWDELRKHVVALQDEESPSRRALLSSDRKAVKAVAALAGLFEGLSHLFEHCQPRCIALALGTTVVNPRELYLVRLPSASAGGFSGSTPVSERAVADRVRALVRHLIMEGADLFSTDMVPTKTFVLVQCSPHTPPDTFLPRQTFSLRPRKARVVQFAFQSDDAAPAACLDDALSPAPQSGPASLDGVDADCIWFQWPRPLPGFRA